VVLVPVPGNPDYQSLVVERADHLVLVEAPLGEGPTAELLDAIAQRFPGKPIRWVVATHHHFDHSSGVPRALAGGATLVTTPGNVAFFRRAAVGPHSLDPDREPADAPSIRAVTDTWSIPGGPPAVEVLRVAPNDHVTEMLAVLVPDAGLLFQGDLVRFPLDGEQPRPQVGALRRLLETSAAGAERVAGVHGEVGRAEEVRAGDTPSGDTNDRP
jgi:glyoxylase-like metal-dependent hydrolase (beta-lactamase superfamily II)